LTIRRTCLLAAALISLALPGCGGDGGDSEPAGSGSASGARSADAVAPARCRPGAAACRSATGRIVFVERVDPDGDGDAHFVIADPQGITSPGLTAIDVRKGLRPRPLPGLGETISAAGPVQTGSYGQRQIHALELNVAG